MFTGFILARVRLERLSSVFTTPVCVKMFWFCQNLTALAARRKFLSARKPHGSGGPSLMR
jgi:hypothetical protein